MGKVTQDKGAVLLIDNDDDEATRFIVGLEQLGWQVDLMQDGAGAIEYIRAYKPCALVLRAGASFSDGTSMGIHKALKIALGALPPTVLLTPRTPDEERSAWQGAGLAGVLAAKVPATDLSDALLAIP